MPGGNNPVIFIGEAVAGAPANALLYNTTNVLGASSNLIYSSNELDLSNGLIDINGTAGVAPLVPGDNAVIYGELGVIGTDFGSAIRGDVNVSGTANVGGAVVALQGNINVADTAEAHVVSGLYLLVSKDAGATIDLIQQIWSGDISGLATNPYYLWFDSQGVFRIREDNTFNSVGQAILALYNPQFTKYTPGATNFERIVQQWESNVATITTEKGGTGTLRALNIGDAGVQVQINGKNITLAAAFTTSGANALILTTTGATNVTLPTSGTLLTTAGSGAALTFPGTLSIASGKTLTGSNTLTFTGTDGSSIAFGAGGTVAYIANKLSVFAATTSAELAGVISDETGSGKLVFDTSPALTTPNLGTPSAATLTNATGLPEGGLTLADNTTNDVSTSKHGFAPKAPNDASKSLDGTGAYSRVVYASQSFALNAVFSPADSTSYYIGIVDNARTNDGSTATPHWMPGFSGTVRGYSIVVFVAGTLGTTENTTASIRFNDATDVTLNSAVKFSAASQTYSGTLSQAVASTDTIKIKLATPAWATNPTNCTVTVTLYVQLTGL